MRLLPILAGMALVRSVAAQPAPPAPPPNDEKVDAKALMQLGVKLLKSQDYLGALAVFKDAYVRFPSAKILLNIGTTQKLLDRKSDAANTYQHYLDSSDADPERRPEVTGEIADLDKVLARLAITAPADAELQIDSDEWLKPAQVKLYRVVPGKYTVRARHEGYKPFETSGEVAVGQQIAVSVELVLIPKEQTIVRVPQIVAREVEEPRSRFAAIAFGHFDLKNSGAAGFLGISADLTEQLAIDVAGILGPNFGGYAGTRFAFLHGTVRPMIGAGMPVFFNNGARYSVRGSGGLEIVINRHFALLFEVGVEHDLNPATSIEVGGVAKSVTTTSIIPSFGATARL